MLQRRDGAVASCTLASLRLDPWSSRPLKGHSGVGSTRVTRKTARPRMLNTREHGSDMDGARTCWRVHTLSHLHGRELQYSQNAT